MEALHDLVKSGKVRYIGASSMWAYQFATMQFTAEQRGWTKFISMQNYYNLLYREEEREMNKFCNETGVGLIPVCITQDDHGHSSSAYIILPVVTAFSRRTCPTSILSRLYNTFKRPRQSSRRHRYSDHFSSRGNS